MFRQAVAGLGLVALGVTVLACLHPQDTVLADGGSGSAASTALATDSVPGAGETFGAEANPTGDPLGGGAGYRRTVSSQGPAVRTHDELKNALAKAKAGQIVYVDDEAEIDLTDHEGLVIPEGVTLASGRGRNDSLGALLYTRQLKTFSEPNYTNVALLLTGGDGVRVTGLRLRGPDPELRTAQMEQLYKEGRYYILQNSEGILCNHASLVVDNCELWGFSHAAVFLKSTGKGQAHIHHNSIHHNQREGLGYGVCLDHAQALVEANVFDWCRHAISATGAEDCGYEARYNLVLFNANGHSFDMHGGKDRKDGSDVAGNRILIHHNTFKATEVPAICIRGVPKQGAEIHHNWFLRTDAKDTVVQSNAQGGVIVHQNRYGLGRSPQSQPSK